MKKKHKASISILVAFSIIFPFAGHGQLSISGLSRVIAGGERGYLYTLSGALKESDHVTWAVTGGIIQGAQDSSKTSLVANSASEIRIVWNENASRGTLTATTTGSGTAFLDVSVVNFDRTISTSNGVIDRGSTATISGGGPSSPGCEALYTFWWESAPDSTGPFEKVLEAKDQHLQLNNVSSRAYYRRALCVNGNILYSNPILIDLRQ